MHQSAAVCSQIQVHPHVYNQLSTKLRPIKLCFAFKCVSWAELLNPRFLWSLTHSFFQCKDIVLRLPENMFKWEMCLFFKRKYSGIGNKAYLSLVFPDHLNFYSSQYLQLLHLHLHQHLTQLANVIHINNSLL